MESTPFSRGGLDSHPRNESPKKVCIVGLGYIGLPTAAILAERGYEVVGVDIRPEVVYRINLGEVHVYEPGLGELVERVVNTGNLRASLEPEDADVFVICVPTPVNEDKSPDLSYIAASAEAIRPHVQRGNMIILESTSPPKTTSELVAKAAIPAGFEVGRDVFVAYCPERVIPGRILQETVENDRVVGGMTRACTKKIQAFYRSFVQGEVIGTDAVTAEMVKLVENSYRDVNIAFANELSMLADRVGADAFEIIQLANRHPRVEILNPGPGVGGHCISVDPWFLVHAAPDDTPLIRTARNVNDAKSEYVVEQLIALAQQPGLPTIGCLGLTYKADVDDIRESPSLEVVRRLGQQLPGRVFAHDPFVRDIEIPDVQVVALDQLIAESEILVLLTDHTAYREISLGTLQGRQVLDTRGMWKRESCWPGSRRSAENVATNLYEPAA